jgi:hypothetical protein
MALEAGDVSNDVASVPTLPTCRCFCRRPVRPLGYHAQLATGQLLFPTKIVLFSAEGDIDRNVARLAVSLSQAASQLEPNSDEIPTIVIDSTKT